MVHIVRTSWSGTSGGPGLTQLAIDLTDGSFGALSTSQAQSAVDAVRAFWNGLVNQLPDEINLTVSPVVDYYTAHNGQLAGSTSAPTAPAVVLGASAAVFSMATGPKVNLNTGVIRNGRRVRGSIYIVPGAGATRGTNGQLAAASRTTINLQGATLRSALNTAGLKLVVWSRPLKDAAGNITRDGATSDVASFETNEKLAVLRGRRD